MTSLQLLASVLSMVVAASGQQWPSDNSCDFTGFDGQAAVSRYLSKVPPEANAGRQGFKTVFPGLEVGGLQLHGLHNLHQFGPAIPYCVNGTRMLQVDLINKGRLFATVPWKTCSGKEGSIMLLVGVSRSTLQLSLVGRDPGSTGVRLRLQAIAPVATEDFFVAILGAGPAVMPVTVVLSKIFYGVVREAWNDVFFPVFLDALNEYANE
ncbi:uncharacterized protein LOC144153818 [Haemaphysalis longicornis]